MQSREIYYLQTYKLLSAIHEIDPKLHSETNENTAIALSDREIAEILLNLQLNL